MSTWVTCPSTVTVCCGPAHLQRGVYYDLAAHRQLNAAVSDLLETGFFGIHFVGSDIQIRHVVAALVIGRSRPYDTGSNIFHTDACARDGCSAAIGHYPQNGSLERLPVGATAYNPEHGKYERSESKLVSAQHQTYRPLTFS